MQLTYTLKIQNMYQFYENTGFLSPFLNRVLQHVCYSQTFSYALVFI